MSLSFALVDALAIVVAVAIERGVTPIREPGMTGNTPCVFKTASRSRSLCISPGCGKHRQSNSYCSAHGGGRRCASAGCNKHATGGSAHCMRHNNRELRLDNHGLIARTCRSPTGYNEAGNGNGHFCRQHGCGRKTCTVLDCDKQRRRGGLCARHLSEQNLAHVTEGRAITDAIHATVKYSPRQCGLMGAIKRWAPTLYALVIKGQGVHGTCSWHCPHLCTLADELDVGYIAPQIPAEYGTHEGSIDHTHKTLRNTRRTTTKST